MWARSNIVPNVYDPNPLRREGLGPFHRVRSDGRARCGSVSPLSTEPQHQSAEQPSGDFCQRCVDCLLGDKQNGRD